MAAADSRRPTRRRSRRDTASLAIDGCSDEQLEDWLRTHFRDGLVGITRDCPADPWLAGGTRYRLVFDAPLNQVAIELGGSQVSCPIPRLRDNFLVLVPGQG